MPQNYRSFAYKAPPIDNAANIDSLMENKDGLGSTDVGDVSWNVPTIGMTAATWVPGTPHSWQAVACDGTEIGTKGMMVAAKTMALTAIDLFTDPSFTKAKAEFDHERAAILNTFRCLAIAKPALNYRD